MTAAPETVEPTTSEVLRIGELAQRTGVTARTLRYWEELGLIRPSGHRGGGERLYLPTDMARVTRIKDLQDLLGFSLAEVRAVLETEDVDALDRARSELRWGETTPERRRQLHMRTQLQRVESNRYRPSRWDAALCNHGNQHAPVAVLCCLHDRRVIRTAGGTATS